MQAHRYRVLVAGTDRALRNALIARMPSGEVDVYDESDPYATPRRAQSFAPDLVVLMVAGYDGPNLIHDVRAVSLAPVLTLLDAGTDAVDALDAGADDYVRLPCSPREIAAKAMSWLRRQSWTTGHAALRFGDLTIDPYAREVRVRNTPVAVPQREFELLAFLAASPRRVYSRSELLDGVWHASPDWLGLRTVTEHVRRLRHRLDESGVRGAHIATVRGAGYRFDPVSA